MTCMSTFFHRNEKQEFFKIKHLRCVDSTNDWFKSLDKDKLREGFVVVADEQTSGKGRLGRKFISPKGGLYFSILTAPKTQDLLDKLTVIAAIAVCDAVREVCGDDASVKWVNDVIVGGKKCSGILTETSENLPGFAIVGIGVNIGDSVDESLQDIACGVKDVGRDTKKKLLCAILENFKFLYCSFDKAKVVADYKARCSTIGKTVRVIENDGKEYSAVAKDFDDDCHLLVIDEQNITHCLSSGEVKILV